MAIAGTRSIILGFTGDIAVQSNTFAAASNAASPGEIDPYALASGFNSIAVPTGAVAVTIIPPAGNTVTLTLKGITGDTGVPLHLTDPTSVGLATGSTTIGITTSGTVTVRLIWT